MSGHRSSVQRWSNMSVSERQKKVLNFLSDFRVPCSNVHSSVSSDCKLVVTSAFNSKKPGQRKRGRAEKTFTSTNEPCIYY